MWVHIRELLDVAAALAGVSWQWNANICMVEPM
jgi:hypothetical protein